MANRQTIMFNSDDEKALKVIKDSINAYADRFNNMYNQVYMGDDAVSVYVGNVCEMLNENYTNHNRTQTEYDSVNFNDIIYKISDELCDKKLNSEVFADYLYDSKPQCMIKIDQKGAEVIYNYHNQMVPIDSLEDDAEFDESNFQLVSTKEAINPPYRLYDSAFDAYHIGRTNRPTIDNAGLPVEIYVKPMVEGMSQGEAVAYLYEMGINIQQRYDTCTDAINALDHQIDTHCAEGYRECQKPEKDDLFDPVNGGYTVICDKNGNPFIKICLDSEMQRSFSTNEERMSKYDALKHIASKTVDQDIDREMEI